jgi:nucleoside-diphosphate-sugar epimerase
VIERVTFAPEAAGRYHAVAGPRAVSVDELIEAICAEMDRPRPALSEPGTLPDDHPAGVFAPYFDVKTRFGNERAHDLAGPAPEPLSYLPGLLDYGTTTRWGKRHQTREAARASAGVVA